jgi:6-pyruvoyltetrahydropterin/6-carboxytetrahydropterin synthase
VKVTARYTFEAAHRLYDKSLDERGNKDLFGSCAQVHGHTYRLEVTLKGSRLHHGMLINFNDVDAAVSSKITDRLDHGLIDSIPEFENVVSTAEEIARWIWRELDSTLTSESVVLEEITVFEGERFSATVVRDDLKKD